MPVIPLQRQHRNRILFPYVMDGKLVTSGQRGLDLDNKIVINTG